MPGHDQEGGRVIKGINHSYNQSSAALCCNACSLFLKCDTWVWSPVTTNCWFIHGATGTKVKPDRVVGWTKGSPSPPTTTPPPSPPPPPPVNDTPQVTITQYNIDTLRISVTLPNSPKPSAPQPGAVLPNQLAHPNSITAGGEPQVLANGNIIATLFPNGTAYFRRKDDNKLLTALLDVTAGYTDDKGCVFAHG
jgi:hypothetical protein